MSVEEIRENMAVIIMKKNLSWKSSDQFGPCACKMDIGSSETRFFYDSNRTFYERMSLDPIIFMSGNKIFTI